MAKRDLGQNFLINKEILRRICDYAELNENDVVYEIGAGFGNLTEEIAKRVKKVYAIEIDPKLFEILKENMKPYNNVVLILGDAVIEEIPEDCNKVMGNLPFCISSIITEKVLKALSSCKIDLAVLMFQKEFAEKLIRKPGNKEFGRISFMAQYYSKVKILEIVPKKFFRPRPKVDAAIVRFDKKEVKWDENLNLIVREIFKQKKKKLINALSNVISKDDLRKILPKDLLEKRVFKLTFDEILKIKEVFENECPEIIEKIKEQYERSR